MRLEIMPSDRTLRALISGSQRGCAIVNMKHMLRMTQGAFQQAIVLTHHTSGDLYFLFDLRGGRTCCRLWPEEYCLKLARSESSDVHDRVDKPEARLHVVETARSKIQSQQVQMACVFFQGTVFGWLQRPPKGTQ